MMRHPVGEDDITNWEYLRLYAAWSRPSVSRKCSA